METAVSYARQWCRNSLLGRLLVSSGMHSGVALLLTVPSGEGGR